MSFYSQPAFWAFLGTTFTGMFGLLRIHFIYKDRAVEKKAKLDMSVEGFRSDNIQKSIDYLNGVIARLEPMVLKHEVMMKQMDESVHMIGIIEKGLNSMSGDLTKKYDEFQQKLLNVTISFQKTIDRVDAFDKKLSNLGKVIKL